MDVLNPSRVRDNPETPINARLFVLFIQLPKRQRRINQVLLGTPVSAGEAILDLPSLRMTLNRFRLVHVRVDLVAVSCVNSQNLPSLHCAADEFGSPQLV